MKKKILILSLDYYPGEVGGAEVAIKEITDRISPEDIEFHLLTLHYDKSMKAVEQLGNVLVHRIGFGWQHPTIEDRKSFPLHLNKHLFQFYAPIKAFWLHRKYHYDGIWAMMAHSCGVPAALFKWWHKDVKYILTLQEGEPPQYVESLMKPVWPIFKRAFTTADNIQVISSFLGLWAKKMGYMREPILVPNAVNVAHFSQSYTPEEITAVKLELGKQTDDIFLVTTSRMVNKNALDDVIKALPLLPERVKFLIYGGGGEKDNLVKLADELKVTNRVRFMGLLVHQVMPKYLKACDIFIRPSRSEGMGNSFVEAMAAGLPVIATQEGGIADFLFDQKNNPDKPPTGFAVRSNNPDDIASQIRVIMNNTDMVNQIKHNAFALVSVNYDWDLIAKNMLTKVFLPSLK
jgi:glycosyltransferase involved in cell wall biosynthesis